MNSDEAILLVKQYILDRTGEDIDINPMIITNARQMEMLNACVQVALEYYKGIKIIV